MKCLTTFKRYLFGNISSSLFLDDSLLKKNNSKRLSYIELVRVGDTSLDESRRMTSLRALYQRAIGTPLVDVERIWKLYEAFETKLNKVLAKALMQEHGVRYMAARQCARELSLAGEGADRNVLATPPRATAIESKLTAAWQRLIDFERTNPARLDDAGCARRVSFAFEQALLVLRYYPHVWHDYAASRSRSNDSIGFDSFF